MPLYEYHCTYCNLRFEALRALGEGDTPMSCPRCDAQNTHRVVSTFAAISRSGGESRMIAGSQGGGCASCSGGHCASCGH